MKSKKNINNFLDIHKSMEDIFKKIEDVLLSGNKEEMNQMLIQIFSLFTKIGGIFLSIFWVDPKLKEIMGEKFFLVHKNGSIENGNDIYDNLMKEIERKINAKVDLIDIFIKTKSYPIWLYPTLKESKNNDKFLQITEKTNKAINWECYREAIIQGYLEKDGNCFYFPVYLGEAIFFDVFIAIEGEKNNVSFWWNVERLIISFVNSLHVSLRIFISKKYALRSAVAAIMSRNMSHNIGSHVLNYLSNPDYFENEEDFWLG